MKILIVSDIHANWPALQAVLRAESDADRILCLGDLVNYGPHPVECVSWAQEVATRGWVISGNHDYAVGWDGDPHCSPPYVPLAAATQEFTCRMLTAELKAFLAGLEPLRTLKLDGAMCVACHASPTGPLFHYIAAQSSTIFWKAEVLAAHDPEFLFLGHTHVPMDTRIRRTRVVNPGSVGQPKHGDPRAAYAIWRDTEITLCRVAYDVEETIRAYQGLGLPPSVLRPLCEVLRTGGELPVGHEPQTMRRT